jgi:hypothetical protein
MARRANESFRLGQDVNLLLLTAWEHGARHVVLSQEGNRTEIRFLAQDGHEEAELLSLPYLEICRRLRQMSARFGRIRVDMGGHHWHLEMVAANRHTPQRLFLHMRQDD